MEIIPRISSVCQVYVLSFFIFLQFTYIFYTLGALEAFDDLYDVSRIKMTILQPRRENVSLDDVCNAIANNPDWFLDILLRTDGYITSFYKKD